MHRGRRIDSKANSHAYAVLVMAWPCNCYDCYKTHSAEFNFKTISVIQITGVRQTYTLRLHRINMHEIESDVLCPMYEFTTPF